MATLPDALRGMLRARHLTQQQAADLMGQPYGTLRGWLLEGRTPDAPTLRAVLDALDATADERRDAWAAVLGCSPDQLPDVVGSDAAASV